jgi:hypothetical protein
MPRHFRLLAAAVLPLTWAAPASAATPAPESSSAPASPSAPASAAAPAATAGTFACDYWFVAWSGGFIADLTIVNHGPAVNGWTARWTMRTATGNIAAWQARMEQPDPFTLTATNVSYNAIIDTGRSVRFGWTASAASTEVPVDLTVNGTPC